MKPKNKIDKLPEFDEVLNELIGVIKNNINYPAFFKYAMGIIGSVYGQYETKRKRIRFNDVQAIFNYIGPL